MIELILFLIFAYSVFMIGKLSDDIRMSTEKIESLKGKLEDMEEKKRRLNKAIKRLNKEK